MNRKPGYSVIAFIVVVCGAFSACKDDPGDPVPYAELLAFDIADDYYYEEIPGHPVYPHFYLTDRSGRLIADTVPVNGKIIRMYGSFDTEKPYDFTRVSQSTINGMLTYFIHTYLDVKPYTYTFSRQPGVNHEIEYVITNLSRPLTDLTGSASSHSYTWHGDHAKLKLTLLNDPGNLYAAFRQEGDVAMRYLFLEGVTPGAGDTLDYQTLPVIGPQTTCSFPANTYLSSSIYGLKDEVPGREYPIDSYNSSPGSETANFSIPTGLFDRYKTSSGWKTGGVQYEVEKITATIPGSIAIPALSFTIDNFTPTNFRMQSPSDYDIYWALFNTINQTENYQVIWSVFGKGSPTVQFELPNIPQIFLPGHSFSPGDLQLEYCQIQRIEGLGNYHGQLQYYLGVLTVPDDQITLFESVRHD
jgi:hypothetical protein